MQTLHTKPLAYINDTIDVMTQLYLFQFFQALQRLANQDSQHLNHSEIAFRFRIFTPFTKEIGVLVA